MALRSAQDSSQLRGRESAYLEDLEVGRFDADVLDANVVTENTIWARNAALLFAVFYDERLAPHQSFSLPLLGEGAFTLSNAAKWPFTLSVDAEVSRADRPFRAQLVRFLRRPHPNEWILAQVPDAVARSKAWARLLAEGLAEAGDDQLLIEVEKVWGSTGEAYVERAQELDGRHVRPRVYSSSRMAYRDLYAKTVVGATESPESRSANWRRIEALGVTDPDEIARLRRPGDAVSTFVYTYGTYARRLVRAVHDTKLPSVGGLPRRPNAHVQLDLDNLLVQFPEIENSFQNLDWEHYHHALAVSRRPVAEAWEYVNRSGWLERWWYRQAERLFAEGLRRFVTMLIGKSASPETRFVLSAKLSASSEVEVTLEKIWPELAERMAGIGSFVHVRRE